MEIKRDLTNLAVRKDLQLPRAQLKQGFMFVFNHGFTGNQFVFMNRLWASGLLPTLANDPRFGKTKNLNKAMKTFKPDGYARLLRVSKELTSDTPHFRVSIPVSYLMASTSSTLANLMTSNFMPMAGSVEKEDDKEEDENAPDSGNSESEVPQTVTQLSPSTVHEMHPEVLGIMNQQDGILHTVFLHREEVLRNATWMDPKQLAELGKSFLGIKVETHASKIAVFLDFAISKEEAQQLTSTPWIGIRNIDVYPLLFNWILTYFGLRGRPMLSSFPISTIARTLPPNHNCPENVRVDEFDLTIDSAGKPMMLPNNSDKNLGNTQRYEDLYSQAGTRDDNSFSYAKIDEPMPVKLPSNIPVLLDWQNLKFAYSNSMGALTVLDLTRFIKCTPSHAVSLLSRTLDDKLLSQMVKLARVSGTDTTKAATYYVQGDFDALEGAKASLAHKVMVQSVEEYAASAFSMAAEEFGRLVTLTDLTPSGWAGFAPIYRFIEKLYADVIANLDSVYEKYSVSYTVALMGWVTLLVKYGKDLPMVQAEDTKIRAAALNQGVDPNWKMPSVPLLSNKIGLLPHQNKVRNILKDSPDFAILPVQAGGGKTPLALIDILLEIKANRSQPYLILCPGHLVAQYVKEIVYFTSGKLNVVPITSYAVRTSGFERIGAILKAAPRNTVVVCNYDALSFRSVNLVYGTTPVAVYPVIEFLRQFRFGYTLLDESHSVKNDSARTRATLALIADIPKKRLASGTMAHDSPSDLAMQVALLDPTLFGTKEEFNETYGLKVAGERVIEWKPGAAQAIMSKIKSRVVVAKAMRKEWAALLPQAQEKFLRVELTTAQLAVYHSILAATMEEIKEAAKKNPSLAKFVAGEENPESVADDEDTSENLEALLQPYLARLEQFITAPARDPLGDKLLSGDDRMSPKVRMIAQRIRDHLSANIEGKVLIFTSYTASAEEIFEQMPPDLKASGILYRASDKVEAGAEFENVDKKRWMVGVENSMNTGLNFQFVSRLIRIESVWNPGTLEQGNCRINRPELKKADRRDTIYYDWIVANGTIDVTKISRLISKIIAVAKFENADDGAYQNLPDVPVIKMSLESVTEYNSWDSNLLQYFTAYKDYKQVEAADFADYRKRHGEISLAPIEIAETPADAALLKRVPYVPGLELYGASELGLVRVDEFMRLDAADTDTDGDESENDEDDSTSQDVKARARELLIGKMVHTEYGDGEITGVSPGGKRLAVRLSSGYIARTRYANTFIVTRTETSTKDIRNQLLKTVGQLPIATPVDVPAPHFTEVRLTKKELRQQELKNKQLTKKIKAPEVKAMSLELQFSVSNGFLGVTYMGDDEEISRALEATGFRPTPQFIFAEVKTAQMLVKQFNKWEAAGFTLDKKVASDISQAFRNLHKVMSAGAVKTHRLSYKFSIASKLKNFFRMEVKPNNDEHVIKPFPMIEDGRAFIMLPVRGQSGTRKAIQIKASGIRWQKSEPSMIYFCPTAAKVAEVLRVIQTAGMEISNLSDLKKEFAKLKKVQFRSDDDLSDMEV